MAIFASTTLGSSDPSKAQSIKALEARAQALAAAQAKQEVPTSMPSPWQGASHVFNTAADAFATRRADQAAAEQRQQLQSLMGQIGPEGPNPQQQAGIAARDPELGKMYAQQAFNARQNAAEIAARKEAAAEAARVAEAAQVAQETRLGARPQTDVARVNAAVKAGQETPEEAEREKKKLLAGSTAEQKFLKDMQTESINNQSTLATLDEAEALINAGIHAGPQAGMTQTIGENMPGAVQRAIPGMTPDPKITENTQRFNQILGGQALLSLTQMKGASSDKDVAINFKIVNDPSATVDNKRKALAVLKTKLAAYLKMNNDTITEAGGTTPTLPKVEGPAAAAAPTAAPAAAAGGGLLEEARKAIAAGAPRDKVIQRLQEKGVDATGL